MNSQIELSIKTMLLAYTISRFSPLQIMVEGLPNNKIYWNLLKLLLTCSKCLTLWIGIIITKDIWLSMALSFLMVIFEKTYGEWENKTKLY